MRLRSSSISQAICKCCMSLCHNVKHFGLAPLDPCAALCQLAHTPSACCHDANPGRLHVGWLWGRESYTCSCTRAQPLTELGHQSLTRLEDAAATICSSNAGSVNHGPAQTARPAHGLLQERPLCNCAVMLRGSGEPWCSERPDKQSPEHRFIYW